MPAYPDPARVLAAIHAVQTRLVRGEPPAGLLVDAVRTAVELSEAALGLLALVEGDADARPIVRVDAVFASERPGASEVLAWLGDRLADPRARPKPLATLLATRSPHWQGYDPRMPTLDNLLVLPSQGPHTRARLLLGNREGGFDAALAAALQPIWATCEILLDLRRRERLQAEREVSLEYAARRFQTFMDAADCLATLTEGRRMLWANRYFADEVRLPLEQVAGRTEDDVLPATVAARTRDLDDEVRSKGAMVRVLEPTLGSDGEVRWWQVIRFPLPGPHGELQIGGLAYDVTEHVHTTAALRERESELAEAQELARTGRWTWDVQRDRVTWDLMFQRLAGLAGVEELNLEGLLGLLHPDDVAMSKARLAEAVREGSSRFVLEHRLLVEGEIRELFVVARVRRGTDTGPQVIAVAQDVSERRRLERTRRELQAKAQKYESLAVLAGSVAHEFNSLLVGILGNAGIALDDLDEDSLAAACVHDIEASAEQAARLTRQMLAFSGRGRFVTEPIDLGALISSMTSAVHAAVSPTVSVRLALHPDLPMIEGDVAQLRQLVLNLVTNGSEAIGDRVGEIVLTTGVGDVDAEVLAGAVAGAELPPGRYVWLEIRDTGTGMDEATLLRAFEPFFSTKATGRGLGLAAVLGIVRSHGGALLVRSSPRAGTSVRMLLQPRAARSEADRNDPGWKRVALR